jgi:predicted RNA methylase
MFNKEFYPTLEETLDQMQIDCIGKIVYEPQAGKGDIVDYCIFHGAKEVIASEVNEDLRSILKTKCKLIGKDSFDVDAKDIAHVDQIIMNPPFSNADKHILHMYEIAPEGCEITAICNWETIDSAYSRERRKLKTTISNYGWSRNIGQQFVNAERTTQVEIGLIKLFKPIVSEGSDFGGFFMEEDEEELQMDGIMPFNEVRFLVQKYVGAMEQFDIMKDALSNLENRTSILGMSGFNIQVGYNDTVTTKEDFGKALQKKSWNYIIDKMGVRSMVTSGMLEDISKFVETQNNIPFTMKNVYQMIDMIIQTRQQNFDKAIIKTIDNFTRHTHENRFSVEGWKTNESHMLGKKFIIDHACGRKDGGGIEIGDYGQRTKAGYMDDLTKVLCYLNGEKYEEEHSFSYMKNPTDLVKESRYSDKLIPSRRFETNKWYEFHRFFKFKGFKKGTLHLVFKNEEDWYLLNKRYGELHGFDLPETNNKKK